jgi:lysophospholipase L1-like esterase
MRLFLLTALLLCCCVIPARADTLFIIGDSTVRNGQGNGSNGQWGWGEPIADFFDPAKITVVNRARGGRSSRTFLTEGLWDQVLSELKPGDFLLIQFGHNDTSPVNDDSRARGTLPGTGEETQEIDNLLTKKRETVHTYGWYLSKFVNDAKAKGARPIVLSPVPRNNFQGGKPVRGFAKYQQWAAEVARTTGVPFVDLERDHHAPLRNPGRGKGPAAVYQRPHAHESAPGPNSTPPASSPVSRRCRAIRSGRTSRPAPQKQAPLPPPTATTASAAQSPFARWEPEIAAFEQQDRANAPVKGALLFIGSSTIRLWNTLASDFPGHKIINRGFGGSQIVDATHFADRIIFSLRAAHDFSARRRQRSAREKIAGAGFR